MKKLILTAFVLALICSVQSVSAWSGWTHKLIAHMADKHLEDDVKAKVEKYLGSSIVDHCVWMDQIRKPIYRKNHPDHVAFQAYRPSIRWHGITVDENFRPSNKRFKNGSGALFPNLEQCVENLRNYRNLPDSAVAVNLKFVIHMLQDMHCPGHIFYTEFPDCFGGPESGPKGPAFMPIVYEGKKSDYHKVWDGLSVLLLYPECGKDYTLFSQKIDKLNAKKRAKVCRGTLSDWAADAAKCARPVYNKVKPNDEIDRDFVVGYRKITESLVMNSAYRIAHLLNDIFK